ncbi:MAG: NAD-dependent epimerase/dehydratase family protein [Nitrospirota bacterium]
MILVTGGTGFLGRNLLKKLIHEKILFRCLVRDRKKIDDNSRVEIIEGDILDRGILDKATKDVDTVIHLAAIIKSGDNSDLVRVNVDGTRNLVDACITNGVKRIIYISSLDAGLKDTNIYGKTKAIAEDIIKSSNIDHIILRPALVYGRGSKDICLLADMIKRYPVIPVFGNGEGLLQPVHVDDVCNIILRLINDRNIRNKIYYVAGEEKISLNALIDKIAGLFSKRVIKIHIPLWVLWLPLRAYNFFLKKSLINYKSLSILSMDKVCEIGEARGDLNFKPLNLEEGLKSVFLKGGSNKQ